MDIKCVFAKSKDSLNINKFANEFNIGTKYFDIDVAGALLASRATSLAALIDICGPHYCTSGRFSISDFRFSIFPPSHFVM